MPKRGGWRGDRAAAAISYWRACVYASRAVCVCSAVCSRAAVQYYFINQELTWDEALPSCPQLNPNWNGLAKVTAEWEWQGLLKALRCATTHEEVHVRMPLASLPPSA